MTEDKMVGWHHRHDGHESEQAPGLGEGQGSLFPLQSTGLQTVGDDWAVTELKWIHIHLKCTRGILIKLISNITPNSEKVGAISLKSSNRQKCCLSTSLFKTLSKFLAHVTQQNQGQKTSLFERRKQKSVYLHILLDI